MSNEVRVSKDFNYGFLLNEQEIRRIHEIILQQMKVIRPNANITTEFTTTFKNNIQEVKDNIDDILAETNGDLWEIEELKIEMSVRPHESLWINIEFRKGNEKPILCNIKADDRNWVYLTLSKLEERFKAIKRFRLDILPKAILIGVLGTLYPVAIILLLFVIFFPTHTTIVLPAWIAIAILVLMLLIALCIFIWFYYFPTVNFYWGDYIQKFDRQQARGKFILTIVLITIVLGVIVSIIGDILFVKSGINH